MLVGVVVAVVELIVVLVDFIRIIVVVIAR